MSAQPRISVGNLRIPASGVVILFTGGKLQWGEVVTRYLGAGGAIVRRAAEIAGFDGEFGSVLDLIAPAHMGCERLIVLGVEGLGATPGKDWLALGGKAMALISKFQKPLPVHVVFEEGRAQIGHEACAQFALGLWLRAYKFDHYRTASAEKTRRAQGALGKIQLCIANTRPARRTIEDSNAVAAGVNLARDLVNEPANVLTPSEFVTRARALEKLGVVVEVLGERDMRALKMNALLGVARGSRAPAYLVTMRWKGARREGRPLAVIGKGVVFDSGGISLKPAAKMEDMKGDMGGAASVVGLMHTLAMRKARANVVGVIGIVENMPGGDAQRPGDIVRAMSGATIEIHNTDAEGRLVLADALWYTQQHFKPRAMIDLATLTGAMIIALGHLQAGLFSNDDALADALVQAGRATGEPVWRMPLSPGYDKLIDSPNADMKNIGGRTAGAVTAAQFLQRFVNDVPWAHLDIAGVSLGSPRSDTNPSWSSGFGVRLLDQMIRTGYEKR